MGFHSEIGRICKEVAAYERRDRTINATIEAVQAERARVDVLVNAGPSATVSVSPEEAIRMLLSERGALRRRADLAGIEAATLIKQRFAATRGTADEEIEGSPVSLGDVLERLA